MIPDEAYPAAVYSGDAHITPATIRVDASETAFVLWIAQLMIGVSRTADDTRLQAALQVSEAISQSAERLGAYVRAELERRERERAADPTTLALRALQAISRPADPPTTLQTASAFLDRVGQTGTCGHGEAAVYRLQGWEHDNGSLCDQVPDERAQPVLQGADGGESGADH